MTSKGYLFLNISLVLSRTEYSFLHAAKINIMRMCHRNISKIPKILIQDSMPDCFDGRDEVEIRSKDVSAYATTCKDRTTMPCFPGDKQCFSLYELCIYEVHDDIGPGYLKPCRNGKHLANCSAALCPHHFKCQKYYCVPYKYTCDGKQDCPIGDDEHNCINRSCVGLFKCQSSNICLHYHDVEDGIIDCIHGDDEILKELSACPSECLCLTIAVTCTNITVGWTDVKSFQYVFIYKSLISPKQFSGSCKVNILKLPQNDLNSFCISQQPPFLITVRHLDISLNKIATLNKQCFKYAKNLLYLSLSNNLVRTLPFDTFHLLRSLIFLDISLNKLKQITQNQFQGMDRLTTLNIIQEHVMDVSGSLSGSIQIIVTTDFHICCFVQIPKDHSRICTAKIDWPFTCNNLLGSETLRTIVWIFSFIILSSNIISFNLGCAKLYRLKRQNVSKSEGEHCYEINITCLHLVDSLNGLHLLTLASADEYYGETYVAYEISWRQGFLCNSVSVISLFSNMMSIWILFFLAISRIMIIKHPMLTRVKEPKFVISILGSGLLLVSVFVTVSSSILITQSHEGQALPLCVMYGVSGNVHSIITALHGLIQLFAVLSITSFYCYVIFLLKKADESAVASRSTGKHSLHLSASTLFQLVFVSISDIICWLPSSIIAFLSVIFKEYPIQLLFWVVLVLAPLNSILNPCILRFGQQSSSKNNTQFRRYLKIFKAIFPYFAIRHYLNTLHGHFTS